MEKWKSRGKGTKAESVLPPTRRQAPPTCLPVDKKKDRGKWSFGGLLRRISSGQNHDVSSNEEDITYIPGHMLSKRSTKKPSKMKSKLGRIPHPVESEESVPAPVSEELSYSGRDALELIKSLRANVEQSQDSLCPCNDSVNSRSSDGSLDALGKASRINRMKARAQAKRDRLCGNSSSDDDSHRSSQSLGQFRSEESASQNLEGGSQRSEICSSRRTRGARTERYIKRMYRDDCTSGSSESKLLKAPNVAPRASDSAPSQYSSNSVDSSLWRGENGAARIFRQGDSSPNVLLERAFVAERNATRKAAPERTAPGSTGYLRDLNENETFEREKRTWPQSFPRATPHNEIYGSLRQRKVLLPPEPPPRSSKPRVFANLYNNAAFPLIGDNEMRSPRRFPPSPLQTRSLRSYNSDNDVLLSEHVAPVRLRYLWRDPEEVGNEPDIDFEENQPQYRGNGNNGNGYCCNSLDRPRRTNCGPATRRTREYREEQENYDPRPFLIDALPPQSNFAPRSTSSLPKGVQLFSRQRLSHCGDDAVAPFLGSRLPNTAERPLEDRIIPNLRKPREISNCRSPSVSSVRTQEEEEAERKRSSKNLEDALSELEAIYNSLRLSDEDLLERAEQRSMQEYRDKAARSAVENSLKSSDGSENEDGGRDRSFARTTQQQLRENDARMKDDMAYRRMNPKERPPSVNGQSSLSQISYLATSPNLSSRDADYFDQRPRTGRRGTPDLTRDDLLFRSLSHANNTLKVIEPQPPFGIPLGPVTTATESDYLHAKPSKLGQTRSLYIPQTEPDVVSDDLAFRNLRKDAPKDSSIGYNKNNANLFIHTDAIPELGFPPRNNTFDFPTKKKRAVRSMSADLYGIVGKERSSRQNDWYNDYIQSTQKLRFVNHDIAGSSPTVDGENLNNCNFRDLGPKSLDTGESRESLPHGTNRFDLDINGNRAKSGMQRKIQVYVPQETAAIVEGVDRRLSSGETRDPIKLIVTESDDSSPDRSDSRVSSRSGGEGPASKNEKTATIESFTEQELSEYKQLCQDLEKLIQRTAEPDTKDSGEKSLLANARDSEDNNSQSEFDELEKLLIEDYELPASVVDAAFDEIAGAATIHEGDDDQSSSRSTGIGAESLSSDNLQSTPTKIAGKFGDDDASSTSEVGIGSSNTGSFTDSVYDKFNQLLREVNDVPYVEPAKTLGKYPVDEPDDASYLEEKQPVINSNSDDKSSMDFANETETQGTNDTYDGTEVKTEATCANSMEQQLFAKSHESPSRPPRFRKEGKRDQRNEERCETIGVVEMPANRQGENVEDESACNDEFYASKDTSNHTVRNVCHVTNRITAYHIVLCSLFLTLLITMIVAQ